MELYQLIRFFTPCIIFLLLIYYVLKNYSLNKRLILKVKWLNFFLGMLFFLFGYILYLFIPLLKKEDVFLAELLFGGSITFDVLGTIFYFEFWNSLIKKNSMFSKPFYLFAGGTFILLISRPWQILYVPNYGFTQPFSNVFLMTFFMEVLFGIIIFCQCIYSIKARIRRRLDAINSTLRNNLITEIEKTAFLGRKSNLQEKNKHLNFLITFTFLGFFITMIGLLPNTFILDSIGVFITFFPQIYYLSKDKEIFLFLFSQQIQDDVQNLQKNIHLFQQNIGILSEIQSVEIAPLIEFIKKSDSIFYKKP